MHMEDVTLAFILFVARRKETLEMGFALLQTDYFTAFS